MPFLIMLSVGYSKRTNAGIVLSNSNNGNVMGSQSVSSYHAHLEFRTENKGNESVGFLLCGLVFAFGKFCLLLE